jgi:two-component system, OmpR family, sensor kinase
MRRLVRPLRYWTVRSRIVAALAVLAAVGLLTVDIAGMTLLRSYLVRRVDEQLERNVNRVRYLPPDVADFRPRATNYGPDFRFYRFDAAGKLLDPGGTSARPDPDLGSLADLEQHADAGKAYTVEGSTTSWRVLVARLSTGQGYIASTVSLRDVEDTEQQLLLINIGVSAVVLLLMGGAAASVVRMGLRPLTRMEATAEEIAAGDLSRRVVDADPHTEAGRLGTALNAMLTRIEEAVEHRAESERRMRQFLADAAHELRTPLTSVQGFAELYRRGGAPPGPALDEAMGCIETDVRRMRRLVDDMLLLARLDEERPLDRRPVDLLAVAAGAVRDAHVRLPTRFVRLAGLDDRQSTFEPVTVLGDEERIGQIAANLVTNALQHTPPDADVVVRVGRLDGAAPPGPPTAVAGAEVVTGGPVGVIEVCDTGPGLAVADAGRVFERLYRADPSRSRRYGGAGLGLSIVAAIVQAHGGRIELWTAPAAGARFRVLLPAQPPATDDGFRGFSEEV